MNPYAIPTDDEIVEGFEPRAARGTLQHMTWEYRISMTEHSKGFVLLWLILRDDSVWSEHDDHDSSWMCAASWRPEMPFVQDCVRKLARMFFDNGCRELTQHDIEDYCLGRTMQEARDNNDEYDRIAIASLRNALEKA